MTKARSIPLSKGLSALIDEDDYHIVSKYKWHSSQGYAAATLINEGASTSILMHRLILNPPPGYVVDHINGTRSDNRRSNIRICSHAENLCNRPMQANNTSGYKGVSWSKRKQKWQALIESKGRQIHLGYYDNKIEAAAAYAEAAKSIHGQYFKL